MAQRFAHVAALATMALMQEASAHGYVTQPISRQEMSHSHYQSGMPAVLRYSPESSEFGGACGAGSQYTESTVAWDGWFKAAGIDVPHLAPGKEFAFSATLTVDHGGQMWVMVACADHIEENLPWTILERAPSDRWHHRMPSNPKAYAWGLGTSPRPTARYVMPEDFSCPSGRGVGRWVWKNGNSCTDSKNLGTHSTETFVREEFCAIKAGWCPNVCPPGGFFTPGGGGAVETWLSCFDFTTMTRPAPTNVTLV